jgi:hypothetical protein
LNYNDPTYLEGNYQYDFETDSLTFLSDSSYLSFLTPNFKEIFIFHRLTPNTLSDLYFESIENPNALGFECNYHPQKYLLQNFPYMQYAPNFANYRLGPLLGSECDPLTTNSLLVQKELKASIDVFPNPSERLLTIRIKNVIEYNHELRILNAIGKVVFTSHMDENNFQINMEEIQLNAGIYWVEIQDLTTGTSVGRKFIRK